MATTKPGRESEKELHARITVDAARAIGAVSPFLFGQNLEPATCGKIVWPDSPLSDAEGLRTDVLEVIEKRLKVPILRWPGGNFASQYHWRNGVGPRTKRPVTYDLAWRSKEDNYFGTDEFIALCDRLGAEPFITVNAGSAAAKEAAGWVEYCNLGREPIEDPRTSGIVPWHLEADPRIGLTENAALRVEHGREQPYEVRYWSIGNETWGDFQTGAKNAEENARAAAEYAKDMRQVDPRIRLTAVGMYLSTVWRFFESQPHIRSLDWNLALLKTACEWIDTVSVHRYFFREVGDAFSGVPFSPKHYRALLACPVYSERKLKTLAATIEAVCGELERAEPVRISFDEWDFGSRTLAHGLATARFLNVLIRMAAWVPIACGEQWIAAVSAEGLVHEPSHLAFELFQKHIGKASVETTVASPTYDTEIEEYRGASYHSPPQPFRAVPFVDAAASLDRDAGKLFLSLINADEQNEARCEIELRGAGVAPTAAAHEMNGESILAENGLSGRQGVAVTSSSFAGAGRAFAYTLPPHSATIIELDLA